MIMPPVEQATNGHQRQGWLGHVCRHLSQLAAEGERLRGVEVGVLQGATSHCLLKSFPLLHLSMVDVWASFDKESEYSRSGDRCARLSSDRQNANRHAAEAATAFAADRRTMLQMTSLEASRRFEVDSLDFAIIDADHTYDAVLQDLQSWWPKLRSGGLLLGTNLGHRRDRRGTWGISRAVDTFLKEHRVRLKTASDGFWSIEKSVILSLDNNASADGNPAVTIAIVCHNYGRYLDECISSVMAQTRPPQEVIVVDDSSTDDTATVAVSWQAFGVRYLRVENQNTHATRRAAFEASHGDVILFLDADDQIASDFIESGIGHFADPAVGLVYQDQQCIGLKDELVEYPDEFDAELLQKYNFISSACMIRRSAIEQSGVFSHDLVQRRTLEDWFEFRKSLGYTWKAVKQSSQHIYRIHETNSEWDDIPYFELAGLAHDHVTLFVAVTDDEGHWGEVSAFLSLQSWPHQQISLILYDVSGNAQVQDEVRHWIADCNYDDVRHVRIAEQFVTDQEANCEQTLSWNDSAGLNDFQFASAMNWLRGEVFTPFVWILGADTVPLQRDACRLLLEKIGDTTAVITCPTELAPESESLFQFQEPIDESATETARGLPEQIEFRCLLMRREVLKTHVFDHSEHYGGAIAKFRHYFAHYPWQWKVQDELQAVQLAHYLRPVEEPLARTHEVIKGWQDEFLSAWYISRESDRYLNQFGAFSTNARRAREASMLAPISVVIPAHGNEHLTVMALRYLDAFCSVPFKAVYVDNGSDIQAVAHIRQAMEAMHCCCQVIRNQENVGFSTAVNQGIEASSGSHVLLLNNDCFIAPWCIETLMSHLDREPTTAVVGPMTCDRIGTSLRRRDCRRLTGVSRISRFWDVFDVANRLSRHGETLDQNMLPFFCALLNRDAIADVGMHRTDGALASGLRGDDEWCARARSKGWKISLALDAYAVHLQSKTFDSLSLCRETLIDAADKQLRSEGISLQ